MVKIKRSGEFTQNLDELLKESYFLKPLIEEGISYFSNNPNDTRLDNHPLTKRMEGKWAFSITGDFRIIYEWISKTTVRFLAIGPHSKVYSKP